MCRKVYVKDAICIRNLSQFFSLERLISRIWKWNSIHCMQKITPAVYRERVSNTFADASIYLWTVAYVKYIYVFVYGTGVRLNCPGGGHTSVPVLSYFLTALPLRFSTIRRRAKAWGHFKAPPWIGQTRKNSKCPHNWRNNDTLPPRLYCRLLLMSDQVKAPLWLLTRNVLTVLYVILTLVKFLFNRRVIAQCGEDAFL